MHENVTKMIIDYCQSVEIIFDYHMLSMNNKDSSGKISNKSIHI